MRMILILLCGAVAVGAGTGCGDDGSGEDGITVAASTGIVADLTREVAGEDVEVVQVIPDTTSPHDFQPSAEDRQRLAEADLVIVNGAGLDATLPLDEVASPVWALADQIPDPLAFGSDERAETEHAGEEENEQSQIEGAQDPHVWMDPTRVAAALPDLADALAGADPDAAAEYRRRASDLSDRLAALDRELAAELRPIPAADRELVTSHDALAYFADRYDLEVVATAFPSTGADAEPSAAALAEVVEAVEATGARALFAEGTDDPEALESVAAETGAVVVDDLLVESPGPAGSYEEMLRLDAQRISAALAP